MPPLPLAPPLLVFPPELAAPPELVTPPELVVPPELVAPPVLARPPVPEAELVLPLQAIARAQANAVSSNAVPDGLRLESFLSVLMDPPESIAAPPKQLSFCCVESVTDAADRGTLAGISVQES